MKDKKIGIPEVIEKFGVPPEKVIEVQALIGDSTDNVPGVPGIGVKTAAQLISEYGDLETLLARAGEIKQAKRRQTLIDNAEKARLSKRLVTLDDNVEARRAARRPRGARARLQAADRLPQGDGVQRADPPGRGVLRHRRGRDRGLDSRRRARRSDSPQAERRRARERTSVATSRSPLRADLPLSGGGMRAEAAAGRRRRAAADRDHAAGAGAPSAPRPRARPRSTASRYEIVHSLDRLKAWIARARDLGVVAINAETVGEDPMQATLCGIALAVAPNEACYVPLAHRKAGNGDAAGCSAAGSRPDQIPRGRRARSAQAAARRPGRAQDRAEPEIRTGSSSRCAASSCARTTTPC